MDILIQLVQVLGGASAIALTVSALREYVLPRLPRTVYPLIAYTLAWALEFGQSYFTGNVDPLRGAAWMVLAGHVREWVSTFQQHGASGK